MAGARSEGALERTFAFKDFREALEFVNRVGELAEAENHHPDIAINYNKVTLRWWTHTAGGITDRDRELAEKTSALAYASEPFTTTAGHDGVVDDVPAHRAEQSRRDPRASSRADDDQVASSPRP